MNLCKARSQSYESLAGRVVSLGHHVTVLDLFALSGTCPQLLSGVERNCLINFCVWDELLPRLMCVHSMTTCFIIA